jgi:hypothetical protein
MCAARADGCKGSVDGIGCGLIIKKFPTATINLKIYQGGCDIQLIAINYVTFSIPLIGPS